MTDYHTLPCGTKIPPEGIKCRVWDYTKNEAREAFVIAHGSGAAFPFKGASDCWRNYEIIKEPKQVPLSYETYHGEPLRRIGYRDAYYPYDWDEVGVRFDKESDRCYWPELMENCEYFKDGKWQPCSVTEEQ